MNLQSLTTAGTLLCLLSTTFFLGVLFSHWPYSYYSLWTYDLGDKTVDQVSKLILDHYLLWLDVPKFIPYTMYGVILVGFLGFSVKIFNPSEDTKYFEYGSFIIYVLCVCAYLSNVRFGVYSAQAGQWGDVDEATGISVILATEVILAVLLLGIVVIQSGLFYAQYEDDRVKTEFLMRELKTKIAQADKKRTDDGKSKAVKATGVSK